MLLWPAWPGPGPIQLPADSAEGGEGGYDLVRQVLQTVFSYAIIS